MWRGRLDDTLIHSATEGFGGHEEPESSPLLMKIVGDVRQSRELRLAKRPTGAAALRRQQGASPDSGLCAEGTSEEAPRRGRIWLGSVELVSLPSGKEDHVDMCESSDNCRWYVHDMEGMMLAPEEDRKQLEKELNEGEKYPYRDPKLME